MTISFGGDAALWNCRVTRKHTWLWLVPSRLTLSCWKEVALVWTSFGSWPQHMMPQHSLRVGSVLRGSLLHSPQPHGEHVTGDSLGVVSVFLMVVTCWEVMMTETKEGRPAGDSFVTCCLDSEHLNGDGGLCIQHI